ncbi:polyprenyl synthetase family protein [Streptomyces zhihengii]|uniref:Polyprenyl synthetase family protein n=1 Tax=Streptomyces zhihengii TaxID=1818004 RepID=A0ABS2V1B4_9ACTN|nr:polyprenyl synthetase family protein [Streptomyces zhihengii]MBM9623621.1 polyprenyl synthetase family protein [Streptomyces zhihengii]
MLGLRPTAAGPAGRFGAPRTARDAVTAVEAELERFLDAELRRARGTDEVFARQVAERVDAFVRRGGKRLRAAFAWCGWRAAGGSGDARAVLRTGAALELLQACALMHDDVMDGSPLRRGAPSVHVELAGLHRAAGMAGPPDAFAHAAAVLAGDLALAWADDLLTETALVSPQGPRLHEEWRAMRAEMVAGQYRDIHAQAAGSSGIDEALTIATLKSALYTVGRPLALGACLADAGPPVLDALRDAGRCAGLAFQLRDDLLGAFGEPAVTGKPAGDDLRARKLSYLLAVGVERAGASGDEEAAAALAPAGPDRPEHTVRRMRAALERTGARAAVEDRIGELAAESRRHFAASGAPDAVRGEFAALVARAAGTPAGDGA